MLPEAERESPFPISSKWQVLGPFQIGTRGESDTRDKCYVNCRSDEYQRQVGEQILSNI